MTTQRHCVLISSLLNVSCIFLQLIVRNFWKINIFQHKFSQDWKTFHQVYHRHSILLKEAVNPPLHNSGSVHNEQRLCSKASTTKEQERIVCCVIYVMTGQDQQAPRLDMSMLTTPGVSLSPLVTVSRLGKGQVPPKGGKCFTFLSQYFPLSPRAVTCCCVNSYTSICFHYAYLSSFFLACFLTPQKVFSQQAGAKAGQRGCAPLRQPNSTAGPCGDE